MFSFIETGVKSKAASCPTACGSEVRNNFSFIYRYNKIGGVTLVSVKCRFFPFRLLNGFVWVSARDLLGFNMFRRDR